MENLGSMEPEQLLRLFMGSLGCAFVIFAFLMGYVFISRRGSKVNKPKAIGTGNPSRTAASAPSRQPTPQQASPLAPTGSAPPTQSQLSGEPMPVDVQARLAGTGREAWLEDSSPHPQEALRMDKLVAHPNPEILRLVREPAGGQVWVQVAGMRYRALSDIRDRTVGERVLAAITHTLRFSNGMLASDSGVVALEMPSHDAVQIPTGFGALSEAYEPDEMLRLMGNSEENQFCVHVAESCYTQLADVHDRLTGQFILEGITRLLQFSNGLLATNHGIGVVPVPSLSPFVHSQLPPRTPSAPTLEVGPASSGGSSMDFPASAPAPAPAASDSLSEEERFLQQLMSQVPPTVQPIERPSLIGGLRRMRKKSSLEPLPLLNLADEINRIFQDKLQTSGLRGTDAKVEARADGGVRIRVGLVYYNSPDEVPDPQLRQMLKLSVAEWEES